MLQSSKAIKQLAANHRLILSGTPIQNNVLELWSLFDFLMPGFLGTEKQFTARYSRPILASRDPKSSPKEQEAGMSYLMEKKSCEFSRISVMVILVPCCVLKIESVASLEMFQAHLS
jgi:SNF2 family DNA or RNA helicase